MSIAGVYWGLSQEVPACVQCIHMQHSMVFLGKRLLLWVCGCKHSTYNYVVVTTRKLVRCMQEFITIRVCNFHMVSIPAIWIG